MRRWGALRAAIGSRKVTLLGNGNSCVTVVGRVAEDNEDGLFLFHLAGGVAFVVETREGNLFRLFLGRFPAGEGVGQIDPSALGWIAAVAQRRAEGFKFEAELQVGDDEWRGEDLEVEDALHRRFLEVMGDEGVAPLLVQRRSYAAEHRAQVSPGAAAGIEHDDPGIRKAIGEPELGAQDRIHTLHLIADDLIGGVPDAEFLAQFGIERVQEGLVEVLDGVPLVEGLEDSARSTRFNAAAVQFSTSMSPSLPRRSGSATWMNRARSMGTRSR